MSGDAEEYLDPLRNVYLLRLREIKLVAMEKNPVDILSFYQIIREVRENVLATYEFYGVNHYYEVAKMYEIMGDLLWKSPLPNEKNLALK